MDSPLRGDVLFSRAWHTVNRIPVGEAERKVSVSSEMDFLMKGPIVVSDYLL